MRDPRAFPGVPGRFGALALLASLCVVLAGEPVAAQGDLDTPAAERQAGGSAAQQVEQEMGLVRDPELRAYVQAVGKRLVRHVPRGPFPYRFEIVDQGEPNAFALPGGFIFVSRGLLELAVSETELANVLGHEIAHVTGRHSAARQQTARRAVNPLMLPGIVLGSVLGEKVGRSMTEPFRAFSAPYVAAYSRNQERAADQRGQRFAAAAGYDPRGMASFLQRLGRFQRERFGHSRLPSFMDSHPGAAERAATAAIDAGMLEWTPRPAIAEDRSDYVRRLDGLVIGPSAREGLFRRDRFYHPDLDFTIRFPRDWRMVNADTSVGAVSPDGRVQIFLVPPVPGDEPEAAARAFLDAASEHMSIDVIEAGPVQIGALRAYRIDARARAGGRAIGGEVTWIADRGRVYRLTAIAPAGVGRKYLGRARNTARTFRPLTPDERAAIRERRMRLVQAEAGETIAGLSARTGNVADLYITALANGMMQSAELQGEEWIKIALEEPYLPEAVPDPAPAADGDRETR